MHSSSSSTKNSCDDNPTEKTANSTNKFVIIGLPLSTLHTPSLLFFKSTSPTTITHLQKLVTESSNNLIHNLHNSIDKCLNFLHLFASENPLFAKLQTLSSEYHNFCQINRRNQRNLKSVWNHDFAAIIPGDSVVGLVVSNGVLNFLNIYNTLLVVRLVLTWFPNSPQAIVSPLSTASALPAELPSTEASSSSQKSPSFHTEIMSHFTSSQKKWMKRFDTKRSNGSSVDH
ncbi:unnamed protein product [Lactuca saligna]|uniref:Uncharacterized protein n=1 Tax=Lactuca saligna TaxID=75948 RepID=A0AA36EGY3_LACSI|nr:unnamed protein product [Lactuca saligna]